MRLRNVGYRADEKKTSFFFFFFFAHPSLTFDLVTRRDLTGVRIEYYWSMLASQAKAEQQSERLVDFDQNQQNRLCLTFTADDRSQL